MRGSAAGDGSPGCGPLGSPGASVSGCRDNETGSRYESYLDRYPAIPVRAIITSDIFAALTALDSPSLEMGSKRVQRECAQYLLTNNHNRCDKHPSVTPHLPGLAEQQHGQAWGRPLWLGPGAYPADSEIPRMSPGPFAHLGWRSQSYLTGLC